MDGLFPARRIAEELLRGKTEELQASLADVGERAGAAVFHCELEDHAGKVRGHSFEPGAAILQRAFRAFPLADVPDVAGEHWRALQRDPRQGEFHRKLRAIRPAAGRLENVSKR